MPDGTVKDTESFLRDAVTEAIESLREHDMITDSDSKVEATEFGDIMAKHFISYNVSLAGLSAHWTFR